MISVEEAQEMSKKAWTDRFSDARFNALKQYVDEAIRGNAGLGWSRAGISFYWDKEQLDDLDRYNELGVNPEEARLYSEGLTNLGFDVEFVRRESHGNGIFVCYTIQWGPGKKSKGFPLYKIPYFDRKMYTLDRKISDIHRIANKIPQLED